PSRSEDHAILRLVLAHPRLTDRLRSAHVWHGGQVPAVIQRLLDDCVPAEDRQIAEAQNLVGIENAEVAANMLDDILEKRRRREAFAEKKRQQRANLAG
ncbi:MAG: hypothetical protein ABR539_13950, partial [Halomonas sp.]